MFEWGHGPDPSFLLEEGSYVFPPALPSAFDGNHWAIAIPGNWKKSGAIMACVEL